MRLFQARSQKDFESLPWERPVRLWPWDTLLQQQKKFFRKVSFQRFQKAWRPSSARKSVKFFRWEQASKRLQKQLADALMKKSLLFHKIDHYQQIFSQTTFIVEIPAGRKMELQWKNDFLSSMMNVIILAHPESEALIEEQRVASSKENCFGGISVLVLAEAQSRVDYFMTGKNFSPHQSFFGGFLGKGSALNVYQLNQSHTYEHDTIVLEHAESGSQGNIFAVGKASDRARAYLRLLNRHTGHHTKGMIHVRSTASDEAIAHIDGLITILPHARDTESFLHEDVLLLSDQAMIKAIPHLEIENNDVSCSHSATVGYVDPMMLYYMTSRGLDPDDAREMLVAGFLSEVASHISDAAMQKRFLKQLKTL